MLDIKNKKIKEIFLKEELSKNQDLFQRVKNEDCFIIFFYNQGHFLKGFSKLSAFPKLIKVVNKKRRKKVFRSSFAGH